MRSIVVLLVLLFLSTLVAAQAPPAEVHGSMRDVMRGILYPSSNVVFNASAEDLKDDEFNPFVGWTAVESAAIALAESANLLTIPGRLCANGRPAPVDQDDWRQWVQGLREASMAAYAAAQSKSQEAMFETGDRLATACANCHDKYRDASVELADRCVP